MWLTRIGVPGVVDPFDVVYYRDEAGTFIAEAPELPGCVTQAGTVAEVLERVVDAIAACREVRLEMGLPEREDLAARPAQLAVA